MKKYEPNVLKVMIGLATVTTGLLVAGTVLARAGGGGHYTHGGGDFSGSGGGGGGGEGELVMWLIYLAFRHPAIGIPLLLIAVAMMVAKNKLNPDNTTKRAITRAARPPAANSDTGAIRTKDPAFSETALLKRVEQMANQIQEAWSNNKMDPVRPYLSDGMFRTFSTQLAINKVQGRRNVVVDHQVNSTRIIDVSTGPQFDTISVLIEATARDVDVPARLSIEEGIQRAANASSKPYSEVWSFLRRPGARTNEDKGFFNRTCPNCGAPIEEGQTTRCNYCDALVNSGQYDWVLAEITQTEAWQPMRPAQHITGLNKLVAKDPDFCPQVAEDRATYGFWRFVEAMIKGQSGPLSKCATQSFAAQIGDAGVRPHFLTAVGSVDLVGCESSDSEGQTSERFYAKIHWSSANSLKDKPVHHTHVLAFVRHGHGKNPTSLSYAHCPNCLGPLDENDDATCAYCGEKLDAGRLEFVLERVMQPFELTLTTPARQPDTQQPQKGSDDAPDESWALVDMGSIADRRLLLMAMAAMAIADGVVTKQEKKLLKMASKRWAIPFETINPILYGQIPSEIITEMTPQNPTAFIDGLIRAALVDGRVDRREEALITKAAQHAGLSVATAKNRINALAKQHNVVQQG